MTDKPPDSGYPKQKPIQAQHVPTEPTKPMPAQPAPYPPQQPPQNAQNQYPPNVWPEGQPPYNYNDQQYQQPPYQQQYYDQQYQQPYDPQYQQPYPPPYQQPYQQEPRKGPDLGNINLNLDPPVAAAISYLFFIVSGICMLIIEKKDPLVRFHAMQSVLFSLSWVVFYFLSMILYIIGSLLSGLIGFLGPLELTGKIANLIWLFLFGVWIVLMVKAYRGERWKLPIIGDIAEKMLTSSVAK